MDVSVSDGQNQGDKVSVYRPWPDAEEGEGRVENTQLSGGAH